MSTHLAVAIVADTPAQALAQARTLPSQVSLVEYRLDMMATPEVELLAEQTPIPAIFTCRPISQGGHFAGDEGARQNILKRALATGHLVDIEAGAVSALCPYIRDWNKIIISWHDFAHMPADWRERGEEMRSLGPGIIKLVGMARSGQDVLPPLAWLAEVSHPAIAIAMGPAGVATRLLAPRFAHAFLTFAALAQTSAPGQVHVQELIAQYGFSHIADADPLLIMFTPDPVPWPQVQSYRRAVAEHLGPRAWLLPIPAPEIHHQLLTAARLARAHGAWRLPGTELVAGLHDPAPFAWRWDGQEQSQLLTPPTPAAVMEFLT